MPRGTANATDRHTTARRDAHEHERRIVAPLEEPVESVLHRHREKDAEQSAGRGDEKALGEHLQQDATLRQADEPKRPDGLAPFLGPA